MIGLRAGEPVAVGDMVVIAVERVSIHASEGDGGRWVAAEKRPVAVCLVADEEVRAFDLDGSELSALWLSDRVPGLKQAIRGGRSRSSLIR